MPVSNNDMYKNMVVNEFNELVLNQSKDFLIKEMNSKPVDSNSIQPMNSSLVQNKKIKNKKNRTKKKKKQKFDIEPSHNTYELEPSFLQSFDDFEDLEPGWAQPGPARPCQLAGWAGWLAGWLARKVHRLHQSV